MIQEGLRRIDRIQYRLTPYDYVLSEAWHYTQKNNTNVDGSNNMVYYPEWRRFNQCFISSGCAFGNKLIDWQIKRGSVYKASGRFDEKAYLMGVGEYKSNDRFENNKRFFWENHRKYLNINLAAAFPDSNPIPKVDYSKIGIDSINKLAVAVAFGRQPMFGIHLGENGGHVLTAIGYRVNARDQIIGLWVSDPAGIYMEGYNHPYDGFMSHLPEKVFKDIFRKQTNMIDLVL
ncbi:hypothetical protein AB3N59_20280 (plasmid) [Leptospira sp. WS92.C1]